MFTTIYWGLIITERTLPQVLVWKWTCCHSIMYLINKCLLQIDILIISANSLLIFECRSLSSLHSSVNYKLKCYSLNHIVHLSLEKTLPFYNTFEFACFSEPKNWNTPHSKYMHFKWNEFIKNTQCIHFVKSAAKCYLEWCASGWSKPHKDNSLFPQIQSLIGTTNNFGSIHFAAPPLSTPKNKHFQIRNRD